MFVKVCGLRTEADVRCAVDAGADAVGFLLCPSPREVTRQEAADLAAVVPPEVLTVAVFQGVPVSEIREVIASTGIRAVQLHGPGYREADFAALKDLSVGLIRAVSLKDGPVSQVGGHGEDMLILDSDQAGSGQTWDWSALSVPAGQWMLAGGLSPDNVAEAVATVHPWGVDVSSGVESSRGVKDQGRIRAFLAAARSSSPTHH